MLECAGERRDFEFQKLHGMGDALYDALVPETGIACRVYAPVGGHRDLLAYLVRRLLENGANSSFVHQVGDPDTPLERLVADPIEALPRPYTAHPRVPRPRFLLPDRLNSRGVDLSDRAVLTRLTQRIAADRAAATADPRARAITEPADRRRMVGAVRDATAAELDEGVRTAAAAWRHWDETPAEERARALERAADLLEDATDELISLCVREAGKTLPDAVAEVREAADFCRYYAARGRADFGAPLALPGPTGEANSLALAGRGVFACISPWNFPLAIFTGQVDRGADGRQRGRRKAGGADAADRRRARSHCCTRPAFRARRCSSSRAPARRSARRWSPIRSSPASSSPARTRPRARSTRRSRRATARSCRSSPRPVA